MPTTAGIFIDRATMTAWLVRLPASVTMPSAALRSMPAASEGEMSCATMMRLSTSSVRLMADWPSRTCSTRLATSLMSAARSRRYSSSISAKAWM